MTASGLQTLSSRGQEHPGLCHSHRPTTNYGHVILIMWVSLFSYSLSEPAPPECQLPWSHCLSGLSCSAQISTPGLCNISSEPHMAGTLWALLTHTANPPTACKRGMFSPDFMKRKGIMSTGVSRHCPVLTEVRAYGTCSKISPSLAAIPR